MSDNPKEAEQILKRIFICDDIYLDLFHLLAPAKIGLELAFVSDRFDALVDTHFKYRKWTLGKSRIQPENILKTNDDGSVTTLPNSIVGFSFIDIALIDSYAIDFLHCIGRLLESDVYLDLRIYEEAYLNIFATSVWPLLNVSAIVKIKIRFGSVLQNFRHLISPSILCDCLNLRMISFAYDYGLQFPPDDSNGSSVGQAICKWLHTPRADGEPKVVKWGWTMGNFFPTDALKTIFLNATSSISFIIRLHSDTSLGPFELINSLTHEQLTSRKIGNEFWLIKRSPIDKSAEQWAKWENEAMEDEGKRWKMLRMF